MTPLEIADIAKTNALLAQWGKTCTYRRRLETHSLTAYASEQSSDFADQNNVITEVQSTDFICLTSALEFGDPQKGDMLEIDGTKYQVQPTNSEKCFRRRVATTTRIHAKQISS